MNKKKTANWKSAATNGFFAVYIVPKSTGIDTVPIGIKVIQIENGPMSIGIGAIHVDFEPIPVEIKAIPIENGLMSIGIRVFSVDFEPILTGNKAISIENGLISIGIRSIPIEIRAISVCIRPFPAGSATGKSCILFKKIYSRAYLRCSQTKNTGAQKKPVPISRPLL